MPLHRLYNLTTGSGNPSYLTGVLPGGAGVQTAGTSANPMISAPRLEESVIEVLDVTGPAGTLSAAAGTPAAPAAAGKLLVIDAANSIGGAKWKQNTILRQPLARGQYGIVVSAGQASEAGTMTTSSSGAIASQGSKAVVMYDGPVQAFCTTTNPSTAISAGMPLGSDGSGNLTAVPLGSAAGVVLATAAGSLAASTSTPALVNVYVGGY